MLPKLSSFIVDNLLQPAPEYFVLPLFLTKVHLTRKLHEKGFSDKEIYNLMTFLDWLITLPEELEETYDVEVKQIEEKQTMAYVTTFERLGMERGLEQGLAQGLERGHQEGEAAALLYLLEQKFGTLSTSHREDITRGNAKQLFIWLSRVLNAQKLEDVFEVTESA